MEKPYFSFLFILWQTFFLLASACYVYSQSKQDSVNYHYESLLKIENNQRTLDAIAFFENELEAKLKRKDSANAAYYLELVSMGQLKIGQYFDSEKNAITALKILDSLEENTSNFSAKGRLLLSLGANYRDRFDYENAINYYRKSLRFKKSIADSISVFNNISNIYKDQKKYAQALKALELPYQRRSELSSRDAATVIGNYGLNQSKLDEPQALENLDLAMKLRLQENDLQGLFSSYKDLANYFLDREDRVTANDYANRAIVVADSLENPVYRKTALLLKLKLDQNLEAIEYGALVDSLDRVKQQSRNAYAGLKYNLDLEEQRTKANEIRAIKEKSKRIAFQATAIVILVVAVSLILMIRMRHKKEKVREVFLTESRISKKVHDEVANDLYQVMTKLQSSSNSKDELLDDLDGIYAKTRDISKEHGLVDVEINFNEQLDDLFRSYETAEISIVTQNNAKVDWNEISELKKKTIYKVLQELLTNMRKHSKASHVLMRFDQMNRRISIHYKDNGIGCNLKKSNGLQNVENRMEALHGRITFESEPNKGFEAKMQV